MKIEKPAPQQQETKHFKRRIGSTYFSVNVHFNPQSNETAEAKISRIIRMETDTENFGKAVETC